MTSTKGEEAWPRRSSTAGVAPVEP
jgi:hypothetical protein